MTSTFVPVATYAAYDDVPVLRKRWVFVLTVLFFIPAAIAIAATGDIYALHKGNVVRYPSTHKTWMVVGYSIFLVVQGGARPALTTRYKPGCRHARTALRQRRHGH